MFILVTSIFAILYHFYGKDYIIKYHLKIAFAISCILSGILGFAFCEMNREPIKIFENGTVEFEDIHERRYGVLSEFASFVCLVASYLAILWGFIHLQPHIFETYVKMSDDVVYLIGVDIMVVIFIVCVYVLSRFTVKQDFALRIDGRIIYPGTKYFILPFTWHQLDVMYSQIPVVLPKHKIECTDGGFVTDIETSVRIELNKIDRKTPFGFTQLQYAAESWVKAGIRSGAARVKIETFLRTGAEFEISCLVDYVPISWGGQAVYSQVIGGEG